VKPLRRAVFLDRDGVLNEIVQRDGHPASPRLLSQLELVPDLDQVARLADAGFLVFVVTNQPDIARGHVDADLIEAIFDAIRTRAPIDDHRVCPHEDADGCACRKPKPGMILDLARHWHVDMARSWMIGDMWRDVEAGRAAGLGVILIGRPYNAATEADVVVDSLTAAVEHVLGTERGWG
jgi:D-glycero-D-manno-heptose 1,7-bisphosphate phosphatase